MALYLFAGKKVVNHRRGVGGWVGINYLKEKFETRIKGYELALHQYCLETEDF